MKEMTTVEYEARCRAVAAPIIEKLTKEGWKIRDEMVDYGIDVCYTIYFQTPRLKEEQGALLSMWHEVTLEYHLRAREKHYYMEQLSKQLDHAYYTEKKKRMDELEVLASTGSTINGKITVSFPVYFNYNE